MKKILFTLLLLWVGNSYSQQFLQISTTNFFGNSSASAGSCRSVWGDYNNDGLLDFIFIGAQVGSSTRLYKNNGNQTFTEQTSMVFPAASAVGWGDYNNDGFIDLALSAGGTPGNTYIFKNNGGTSFTNQTGINLPGIQFSTLQWADLNNDGNLDLVIAGGYNISSLIFMNNGDNTFTESFGVTLTGITPGSSSSHNQLATGDYDNDGDVDILTSKIYENNGNQTFTEQTSNGLPNMSLKSCAFGDYNNDGFLDAVLVGNVNSTNVAKIYKNNGNSTFSEQTGINNLPGLVNSSVAWGDYDNDGQLDLLMSGYLGTPVTKLFKNNGNNTFTEQSLTVQGIERGTVTWGDYNNDGQLDILSTGFYDWSNATIKIYKNNLLNVNTAPSPPSGLTATVNTNNVVFRWQRSTDSETPIPGLSYNMYVGSTAGSDNNVSSHANMSSGFRKIAQLGNTFMDTTWAIDRDVLTAGSNYWSVQAIDNAFKGSAFAAEGTFFIPLEIEAGNDVSIVCGGSTQLNVSSDNLSAGTFTYSWSPAAGLNASNIANPIASPIQTTTYTVEVSNGSLTAIDSVTVVVNSFTANAGSDKTVVCGGDAYLSNVITNYTGSGSLNYSWSPSTGLNNVNSASPISNVIVPTGYTVTVTTDNGCVASDAVNVNINPLIVNAGMDKITSCFSSIPLNMVTSNYTGAGTLAYSWSNAPFLNNPSSQQPIATLSSNTTFSVTATTNNGCSATDNITVFLEPLSAPSICLISIDTLNKNNVIWEKQVTNVVDSFCIYRETSITNIYEKIGVVSYDSMSIFIDNTSLPSVVSNRYKISIKDKCGLESSMSLAHKTMHLSINQGSGNAWNLIWEQYDGFPVSSYRIYRGTASNNMQLIGSTSGINSSYSDFSAPAGIIYYQVEVISPYVCTPTRVYNTSRSNVATNNPIGINEETFDNSVRFYPNPTMGQLTMEIPARSIVEIINLQGQTVKHLSLINSLNTIDLDELTAGVYSVRIITDKKTIVRKLVKQ
ncbi:MAG: regulatory domain of in-like proprotein convertase [Bacteroidetes bacterium]|jgi:hypothetical protein|nr:regulatory domain of in-like proprotein convertase [Bacteroidota bacterium]